MLLRIFSVKLPRWTPASLSSFGTRGCCGTNWLDAHSFRFRSVWIPEDTHYNKFDAAEKGVTRSTDALHSQYEFSFRIIRAFSTVPSPPRVSGSRWTPNLSTRRTVILKEPRRPQAINYSLKPTSNFLTVKSFDIDYLIFDESKVSSHSGRSFIDFNWQRFHTQRSALMRVQSWPTNCRCSIPSWTRKSSRTSGECSLSTVSNFRS